jgi:hypothetical protein
MASPDFDSHGTFPILPSKWLCIWIAFVTAAAVILCATHLPPWIALIATAVCTGCTIHLLRRDALQTLPESIVTMRFGASRFDYQFKNGQWCDGNELLEGGPLISGFVSRWLSVIAVRVAGARRRRYVVLMPDSLDGEAYRRTRIWLKWTQWQKNDAVDK